MNHNTVYTLHRSFSKVRYGKIVKILISKGVLNKTFCLKLNFSWTVDTLTSIDTKKWSTRHV